MSFKLKVKNEELSLSLYEEDIGDIGEGNYYIEGVHGKFRFDEHNLSKHFLFLGAPGTGKTNAIFQFVDVIKNKMMSDDDVMIIFDTKGDYKSRFYDVDRGDIIISNFSSTVYWNLFEEILYDPEEHWYLDAFEVSREIFYDNYIKAKDPYFPLAAADVTAATLLAFLRIAKKHNTDKPTNYHLFKYLVNGGPEDLVKYIGQFEDLRGALLHISNPGSGQTQGVMSEIRQVLTPILSGDFRKNGDFSIRKFINQREGRTLFIEYNTAYGQMLTPIYRVMIDLALKEGLSRQSQKKGNIFIVIDEFALLPHLFHIEDAINFGRELGMKLLIGIQNVSQIIDEYDLYKAYSILSSFGTVFAFNVNDDMSKQIITARYGERSILVSKRESIHAERYFRQLTNAPVIEPVALSLLEVGQCLICMTGKKPRKFKFKLVK